MKKRSCALALSLCLGLLTAGLPAADAASYPKMSYQEAHDTYGFTVDMGDLDLGRLTPDSEVEDQFITVTNNSSEDMYVDLINYGGFSVLGDTSYELTPGSSHDYRLLSYSYYNIAKDGPNRIPVSFHVCANYEVRWDYIGGAAFGTKVGGTDFEVDAAWVSYDKMNEDDFKSQDWVSMTGLTGGRLELGTVRQEVIDYGYVEGQASFSLTNLLEYDLNVSVSEKVSYEDRDLRLEVDGGSGALAPGESRTVTVSWDYHLSPDKPLPDGLTDSRLMMHLSAQGTSKSIDIPLDMDFSASDAYPLQIICSGSGRGTVTDVNGTVLSDGHPIPGSGLTIRFVPDPGSYLKSIQINGKDVSPRGEYRFEGVTEKQTLYAVFDLLENKPISTYPVADNFYTTAPSFGTTTVDDPSEGLRTVYLYPAGTLIGTRGEWGYVRDIQAHREHVAANPTDSNTPYYLCYMGMMDEDIPMHHQGDMSLAEFPADRPLEIGGWRREAVMIVSSHPAARNEPAAWAKADVEAAVKAGLVPVTLQSAYNQPTTRAEFCALATRIYEEVLGPVTGYENQIFQDTTDLNVRKMAYLGVVNGVGNGCFAPDLPLTREQAATMLARLAQAMDKPLPASTDAFADQAEISSWALDAVGRMQASGIMGGVGENRFAPKGSYTREQSIITVLRTFRKVQ